MPVTTIGVDLAKQVFAVHGVDQSGKTVIRKMLRREQMVPFFTRLASCTIAMEACSNTHYWARPLAQLGHTPKLIAPQLVKPYVKSNKHDAGDAEAICEAASRPGMRFVAVKSPESQAVLALHRVREGFIKARTAQANQLHGLLSEFGLIVPQGMARLMKEIKGMIANEDNGLPVLMRHRAQRLLPRLLELDRQVQEIDNQVRELSRQSSVCRRLEQVPGIGPIKATALVATVGENIRLFKNGRQLAAFLGLVPKQHSSGGKQRLQGISKRADGYFVGCWCTERGRCCTTLRASQSAAAVGWHNCSPGETAMWLAWRKPTRRRGSCGRCCFTNESFARTSLLLPAEKSERFDSPGSKKARQGCAR